MTFGYRENHWKEFMRTGSTVTNDISFTGGGEIRIQGINIGLWDMFHLYQILI